MKIFNKKNTNEMNFKVGDTKQKAGRNSNIELLRIILTIFVIAWHVGIKLSFTYGQLQNQTWIFNSLKPFLSLPVITFGLISGFYLGSTTPKRFYRLLKDVMYYMVVSIICISLLAFIDIIPWTRTASTGLAIDKYALGMILSGGGYWWNIWAILIIYAIAPFLVEGIKKLDNIKLEIIVIILFWLFFSNQNILFTLTDDKSTHPGSLVGNTQSVTNYAKWFASLLNAFMIGYFINRRCQKMFQPKFIPIYFAILANFCFATAWEYNTYLSSGSFVTEKIFGRSFFKDHSDVFMPIAAVCMFSVFNSFKIRENKIINYLSKISLPIYLFQFLFITISNYLIIEFNLSLGKNNKELEFIVYSILIWFVTLVFSILVFEFKNFIFKNIKFKKGDKKNVQSI